MHFYTCKKLLRGGKTILNDAKFVRNFKIPEQFLQKLKARYKNFNLTQFDEWTTSFGQKTSQKDDLHYYDCYMWSTYDYAAFRSAGRDCNWWLRSDNNNYNKKSKLSIKYAGGLEVMKKLFDKNVTPIKKLVEKIGDLSEITLHQKNFFLYDESNYINHTFYNKLSKKVQTYGIISTPAIRIGTAAIYPCCIW